MLSSRNLKYHTFWLSLGWLLLATIIGLSLWPKPPTPDLGIPAIDKIGHFIAWFTLMSWFCFAYLREAHLAIGIRLLLLGIALEILQWTFGHRFFEIADIAANILGITAAWLAAATRFNRLLQWTEHTLLTQLP